MVSLNSEVRAHSLFKHMKPVFIYSIYLSPLPCLTTFSAYPPPHLSTGPSTFHLMLPEIHNLFVCSCFRFWIQGHCCAHVPLESKIWSQPREAIAPGCGRESGRERAIQKHHIVRCPQTARRAGGRERANTRAQGKIKRQWVDKSKWIQLSITMQQQAKTEISSELGDKMAFLTMTGI